MKVIKQYQNKDREFSLIIIGMLNTQSMIYYDDKFHQSNVDKPIKETIKYYYYFYMNDKLIDKMIESFKKT